MRNQRRLQQALGARPPLQRLTGSGTTFPAKASQLLRNRRRTRRTTKAQRPYGSGVRARAAERPPFRNWGGLRSKLEESGITPRLILVTDLAGNPSGGRSKGATAPSSIELSLFFDLEKSTASRAAPSLRRFRTVGATASRPHILGTPSALSRFLASRHTASLTSFTSKGSTNGSRFASGALQRWMISRLAVQLRVHAERVLWKPIRHSVECAWHERVLRHLGGSRKGEPYQAKLRDDRRL